MNIIIDPEFKTLIEPLAPEEYEQLAVNILKDGCRDPLVVWGETLIDGHNRYAICQQNGLPFKTVEMHFADRETAMDWMDANQLGRRNLSPIAFKLALGRRYNRSKKTKNDGGTGTPKTSVDQNDPQLHNSTAAKLGAQHGVSEATVKRAGKLAGLVESDPEIKKAITEGKPIKEVVKQIKQGGEPKFPLPPYQFSEESKAKGEQAGKDSETLWLLKSTWKKSNKKEKAVFVEWLKINK